MRSVRFVAVALLGLAVPLAMSSLACGTGRPPASPTAVGPTVERGTPSAGQEVFPTPTLTGQRELLSLVPAHGLGGWQHWLQPGSRAAGENIVATEPDPLYGQVVEFRRTCSARDGGAAGLYQTLALDVAGYQDLRIYLVGRVMFEEGGNIANHDPRWFPEGAVQVRVKYVTAGGQEQEWFHGFYVQPVEGADRETFTQVAPGEWFTYTSPNLAKLPAAPQRITDLRIYGFGWQFEGQVADLRLMGS